MTPTDYQSKILAKIAEMEQDLCETGMCDSNPIAQTALRALRKAIERHGPEIRYVNPEYTGSFDTEEEALDGWDEAIDGKANITTFIVCAGCSAINKSAMENADDWDFLPEVYFPCPELTEIKKELL